MNKVILEGGVGADPEVKHMDNGKAVCRISLATSERYKDKSGEVVNKTTWHNLVAWSPLAEIFEKWVSKGSRLLIEGKIDNRSYEDKDGVKKYVSEIIVKEFSFTGGKNTQAGDISPERDVNEAVAAGEEIDDLPF